MESSSTTAVTMVTIPNSLTLFRIAVIPVVIGCFFWHHPFSEWLAAILFMVACITDFLDGYMARALKQTSSFGAFLDPVADKLLVSSSLLMLAGTHKISGLHLIPACIILCREILVSGLREFLAEVRITVPVSYLAKWKTTIQMVAIGFLIWGNPFPQFVSLPNVALAGLWMAGALTLLTGYDYVRYNVHHLMDKNP